LFDTVRIDFEIFLAKIADWKSFSVDGGYVNRNEIGVESQYIFRFLLFWKHFAWSLLGGRRVLVLRHTGSSQSDEQKERKG